MPAIHEMTAIIWSALIQTYIAIFTSRRPMAQHSGWNAKHLLSIA
jgi:hypothetical protein